MPRTAADRLRRTTRLRLETLEDRLAPATLLGLTDTNTLLRFDSATPGTTVAVSVSGLNGGENLLGIDYRPANGQLYGVTSQNRLLTLTISGTTATVGTATTLTADPTDGTNPFTTLAGTTFGVDFNPAADRLRVVSDTNQNLRINVDTARVITDADLNPSTPDVVASAYSNNFAGTTTTILFGLDDAIASLVIQSPPNNGTLATVGMGLGSGIDVTLTSGFDVVTTGGPTRVNTAFASLTNANVVGLYTIDLTTGTATLVGAIGAGTTPVGGLAVVPAGTLNFSIDSFAGDEDGGTATITVTRTGGSLGVVSVDFATAAGTALAGADFTSTNGTLVFADGETTPKTFTVALLDDQIAEGNEILTLTLTNATAGAVLGARNTATLVIRDNEVPTVTLFAVDANNRRLFEFDSASPGTIRRNTALTGLNPGDIVQGIDVRPADGEIYALITNGTTSRLATINPFTGAVSAGVPLAADPADGTNPFTTLAGSDFGFDFNPTNDRLRITSDAAENLLVNPDNGFVTTQTPLNPGTPNVVGSAYTNSFVGTGSTTLHAIDAGTDQVFIQNPPGNGTLVLVGNLGVNIIDNAGFEINAVNNQAFLSGIPAGTASAILYSIDLTTGAATRIGTIAGGVVINGLTSVTDPVFTDNQALVNRLFQDLLARPADSVGLTTFTFLLDTGTPLATVVAGIVNSPEYQAKTVNDFFLRFLDRDADAGGLAAFTNALATGATQSQVAAAILGSAEYFQLNGGTNDGFLAAAFQEVLGRAIDPTGQATFTALLAAGASRQQVAQAILDSFEGLNVAGRQLYLSLLKREPDALGLSGIVSALQSGTRIETIIIAMASSPEYVGLA